MHMAATIWQAYRPAVHVSFNDLHADTWSIDDYFYESVQSHVSCDNWEKDYIMCVSVMYE